MYNSKGYLTEPNALAFMVVFYHPINGTQQFSICKKTLKVLLANTTATDCDILIIYSDKPPINLGNIGMYKSKKQEKKDIALAIKEERYQTRLNKIKQG